MTRTKKATVRFMLNTYGGYHILLQSSDGQSDLDGICCRLFLQGPVDGQRFLQASDLLLLELQPSIMPSPTLKSDSELMWKASSSQIFNPLRVLNVILYPR